MLEIQMLPLGPLQTNCYLAACTETEEAAVVDPAWDGEAIAAAAADEGWTITHILLTHAHFDHVGGLSELKEATGAPIFIHPDAVEMLRNAPQAASMWGLQVPEPPAADEMVAAGQTIAVGELSLHVLLTPGHAPGHVSFYLPEHDALFDGDVLFQQGIGRTDFPQSDHATLMRSIREELLTLPDHTRVFPGHGNPTTIGDERRRNPFLQGLT